MLQDSFQIYQIALPVQTGKEGGEFGRMKDGEGGWGMVREDERRMREGEGGWGRMREDEGDLIWIRNHNLI